MVRQICNCVLNNLVDACRDDAPASIAWLKLAHKYGECLFEVESDQEIVINSLLLVLPARGILSLFFTLKFPSQTISE